MEDTPENFSLKHWVKLAIHRKGLVAVMISYYIIPLLQGASWCKMNEKRESWAAAGVACDCDSCFSVADWGNFSHQTQGVWFKLWWDTMLILSRVLARALVTKYCRLGGLHNRNLFSHCFWRWGSWALRCWRNWFLLRTVFVCKWRSPLCVFTWSSFCTCVCPNFIL